MKLTHVMVTSALIKFVAIVKYVILFICAGHWSYPGWHLRHNWMCRAITHGIEQMPQQFIETSKYHTGLIRSLIDSVGTWLAGVFINLQMSKLPTTMPADNLP